MLALPSTAAAETAVRTQQVLAEETGVTNVADPLGGSWYVEALTDRLEAEAEEVFARIRAMSADGSMTGGILRGIETGWFTGEIADAAFEYQQKLEKGDKRIVGVTSHRRPSAASSRSSASAPRSSAPRWPSCPPGARPVTRPRWTGPWPT